MNTIKCPNCNALLSHPADAKTKKCEFCGFETYIKPKTVAQPRVNHPAPTPRQPASAQKSGPGCLIIVLVLFVLAGAFLAFAFSTGLFDTGLPATTGLNETITLEGRTETIPGVAIKATGVNTKVFIRDCNIKADKLLVATQPNIEIEIVNSRIETSDNTFELPLNPKIRISENSEIVSTQGTVFKGGQNVEFTLTNSRIIGDKYAFEMGNNGTFVLEGKSLIRGGKSAIKGEHNIHVEMLDGSAIESDGTVLDLQYNGRLKMENAVLKGDVGVEADSNFELTMVSGKLLGENIGLSLATNGKVKMEGGVIAGKTAIEGNDNSITVEMEGGEIIGTDVGILGNQTLKLEMESGKIRGQTAVRSLGDFGGNDVTIEGGAIEGVQFGIQFEKRGTIKLTGGTVTGQTAIQVPEYSEIKISGGTINGAKVGIEGADRLTITGQSGTIKGGEYAIVKGSYGSLPEKTVTIEGDIKEKKTDRPHIPAGFYVNGKRVM
ncbi:MAG: hypothetical protein JXX29_16725 [Deltaproteobacteria bacterium]|nr:hypothetical protein [Deltaproteobacteria bacterium]MBN2673330.1 hypothetical protein [Deltaproteobacteria bacterium]